MLGIGPGGLASDHELFEVGDGAKRGRMFVECIDHMIKIWAQDPPYDIKGEFWNIQIKKAIVPELGFGTMPKPLQQPHPPIHISIGSPNSSSARMAASRGWGIISGPNAPTYSIASHWKAYAETCAAAGRPARGENWRVARNVIVAPTDAEAEERVFGARHREPVLLHLSAHRGRQGRPAQHHQAAARHERRGVHAGRADGRMRHLRLAQDRARQADRVPRPRRAVRHAC